MTDPDLTSQEQVNKSIGMCRLHGLHNTEATLRALSAERDALITARDMMGKWWEKEKARVETVARWHEEIHGMKFGPALFEGQQEYVRYEDYAALSAALEAERERADKTLGHANRQEGRAEVAEAKLKGAVEVLRMIESIRPMWEGGVRGPSADNLSNALEHMRAEARAFLASLEGDKP